MFHGCFKGESRVFQGVYSCVPRGYKAILTIFPVNFMVVSLVLQERFVGVSRVFEGVTRVLHFCFKDDSSMFQGCY